MLDAMDIMNKLPEDTKIFCGHEYTQSNIEFLLKVDPHNPYLEML
jgi:hydroxyacylglutathione hydrolase